MADLQNAQIDQSYPSLIKTFDNGPISTSGFPLITDGQGTNTMIAMSATELQLGTNINTQYFKQYANSGGSTELKDVLIRMDDATASQYFQLDAANAGMGAGANYFLASAAGNSIVGPLNLSGATINEVSIKGDGTNAGKLKLFCEDASGAHNVTLEGPAHTGGATYALKFPNVQSAGTQILEADASGNLAWINTPGGGGGGAGLVAGTGTDAMQSAASLTTTAAVASGADAIALGEQAVASGEDGIAIGRISEATNQGCTAYGYRARATKFGTVAIGSQARAQVGNNSIAIGPNAEAAAVNAVALGYQVTASTADTVTIKRLQMLDYASLSYADDTAAAAGGIPLGGVYHTSGALKIRIA